MASIDMMRAFLFQVFTFGTVQDLMIFALRPIKTKLCKEMEESELIFPNNHLNKRARPGLSSDSDITHPYKGQRLHLCQK